VQQLFPRWTNALPTALLIGLIVSLVLVVGVVTYYFTPKYWEVGYQPKQPIAYSHQLHAQQLGIDCRYCHSHVEESRVANIPSPSVCMNCHTVVDEKTGYLQLATSPDGQKPSKHWENPELAKLRQAYASGTPIQWRRVHKLPDYVQFNHAVHVNAGVSCYSCHGRVDQMPEVHQVEPLSMAWCLECHRAPEKNLVDTSQIPVTHLWDVEKTLSQPEYAQKIGARLKEQLWNEPSQSCSACHY